MRQKEPGQGLSHTLSSAWAVDEFQSLTSLSFYPNMAPWDLLVFTGALLFAGRQRAVPLAWFRAFHWSLTNLGNRGCSPESLVVGHHPFLICLSCFRSQVKAAA